MYLEMAYIVGMERATTTCEPTDDGVNVVGNEVLAAMSRGGHPTVPRQVKVFFFETDDGFEKGCCDVVGNSAVIRVSTRNGDGSAMATSHIVEFLAHELCHAFDGLEFDFSAQYAERRQEKLARRIGAKVARRFRRKRFTL